MRKPASLADRYCSEDGKLIPRTDRNGKKLLPSNYSRRLTCCDKCTGARRNRVNRLKNGTEVDFNYDVYDYFNYGRVSLLREKLCL